MKTELIAEAVYQLRIARKGKSKTERIDNLIYTFYENNVNTISDGVNLTVQFEMNSKFFSVAVR